MEGETPSLQKEPTPPRKRRYNALHAPRGASSERGRLALDSPTGALSGELLARVIQHLPTDAPDGRREGETPSLQKEPTPPRRRRHNALHAREALPRSEGVSPSIRRQARCPESYLPASFSTFPRTRLTAVGRARRPPSKRNQRHLEGEGTTPSTRREALPRSEGVSPSIRRQARCPESYLPASFSTFPRTRLTAVGRARRPPSKGTNAGPEGKGAASSTRREALPWSEGVSPSIRADRRA